MQILKQKFFILILFQIISFILIGILFYQFYQSISRKKEQIQKQDDFSSESLEQKIEEINKSLKKDMELRSDNDDLEKIKKDFIKIKKDVKNNKEEKKIKKNLQNALMHFEKQREKIDTNNKEETIIYDQIITIIKWYKKCFEKFIELKKLHSSISNEKRIYDYIPEQELTEKDFDDGRQFLSNYANILNFIIEDFNKFDKCDAEEEKISRFKKIIWDYMKYLMKKSNSLRNERLPKIFSKIPIQ
ncbi:MAG: hypothetical protein PR2021_4610 [Candidatus Phytoplasma pruni]|uniref:hypothetical protein n=1 Tax=Poinsettia branch-inducing phytoplasma TaxID=138647 RepID=UPI000380E4BD|nr:hypothetical protein [Poinsettia branch-inducing phytoplasma]WEK82527.1 MAG: hypothetical protein PR2021_4610 [Candidatus Phytoplasma pruni]